MFFFCCGQLWASHFKRSSHNLLIHKRLRISSGLYGNQGSGNSGYQNSYVDAWWFISAFHRSCKSTFWRSLSRESLCLRKLQNTCIIAPCDLSKMRWGGLRPRDCGQPARTEKGEEREYLHASVVSLCTLQEATAELVVWIGREARGNVPVTGTLRCLRQSTSRANQWHFCIVFSYAFSSITVVYKARYLVLVT